MKKLTAVMLFAVFGLAVPLRAIAAPVRTHAQADNNAARIATQKRNAKLSHKREKAQERAMRKARKRAMNKAMKSMRKSPQTNHSQTTPAA